MKVLFFCAIFFSVLVPLSAQSKVEWLQYESTSNDLRFLQPSEPIVLRSSGDIKLYSSINNVNFEVAKMDYSDPSESIKRLGLKWDTFELTQDLVVGNYRVKMFESKGDSDYSAHIYAASKKNWYQLSVWSMTENNEEAQRFLRSIIIDGMPIFEEKAEPQSLSGKGSVFEDLKTSPAVKAAIEKTCLEEMRYGIDNSDPDKKFEDTNLYSRRLIIVQKAKVEKKEFYEGTRGKVRLRVLFGSNGCVKSAIVLSKASEILTKTALKSIRSFRFLPAEISGKPVDYYKVIEFEL